MCCDCDPSVHLDVPSIGLVFVCVCRMLSPHLGLLFLSHTMSSRKSLQLLRSLHFGILYLSAIRMNFVKIILVMLVSIVV